MKFNVEVTETLHRIISIDADDELSAILEVRQLYRAEEIVLDSSDYIDTDIDIVAG